MLLLRGYKHMPQKKTEFKCQRAWLNLFCESKTSAGLQETPSRQSSSPPSLMARGNHEDYRPKKKGVAGDFNVIVHVGIDFKMLFQQALRYLKRNNLIGETDKSSWAMVVPTT